MIKRIVLTSEETIRRVTAGLITASAWFEVTPLPDDEWEVAVKDEPHYLRVIDESL